MEAWPATFGRSQMDPYKAATNAEGALSMAVEIVSAYVSHNPFPANELGHFIRTVHGALIHANGGAPENSIKPAVAVRKSVFPDYIICLEDGKRLKMLKRYLRTHYKLSPEAYRAKWGLPADYPMVAPNYAAARSAFAKKIGLGRAASPRG